MVELETISNVGDILNKKTTWYLVDTKKPLRYEAITILVSSPNPRYYKEFLKFPCTTIRYMPIWSLDEIYYCRNILFPDIEENEMLNRFDRWGGIPRFVLEKIGDKASNNSLEKAIVTSDLKKCIMSIGEIDSPDDASHRILHIVTTDYCSTTIMFSSIYVAEKVAEYFDANRSKNLLHSFLPQKEMVDWAHFVDNYLKGMHIIFCVKGEHFVFVNLVEIKKKNLF